MNRLRVGGASASDVIPQFVPENRHSVIAQVRDDYPSLFPRFHRLVIFVQDFQDVEIAHYSHDSVVGILDRQEKRLRSAIEIGNRRLPCVDNSLLHFSRKHISTDEDALRLYA